MASQITLLSAHYQKLGCTNSRSQITLSYSSAQVHSPWSICPLKQWALCSRTYSQMSSLPKQLTLSTLLTSDDPKRLSSRSVASAAASRRKVSRPDLTQLQTCLRDANEPVEQRYTTILTSAILLDTMPTSRLCWTEAEYSKDAPPLRHRTQADGLTKQRLLATADQYVGLPLLNQMKSRATTTRTE